MAYLTRGITPDNDKKVTQTIALSPKLRNALIIEAEKNGLSLSAQINMVLNRYMDTAK
jgi:predicted HicB family RNase H-like nuclease